MVLCDTDIVIEIFKNNPQVKQECQKIGIKNLAISAISVGELFRGALDKKELEKIKTHLQFYHLYTITEPITETYLDLMGKYCLSHRCHVDDMLIAATALVHNFELYTLNTKDFRFINGIKLFARKN
ncbi:MAG: type II toxin-antitoxin system VapC family toxin [Bacteroidota bacterium]